MGMKYKNPPLQESYCEFLFEENKTWDMATPGLLYEQLKGIFPLRDQSYHSPVNIKSNQQIVQSFEGSTRLRCRSNDEACLLQIDKNFIAINRLPPYITWADFLRLIERSLSALQKVINEPVLRRVTLRYINRIQIPLSIIILEDYFNFFPKLKFENEPDLVGFIAGAQVPFDKDEILKLEITSAAPDPKKENISVARLDLHYLGGNPDNLLPDNVNEWLTKAHDRIEKYFEASITDLTRDLFNNKE